VNAVSVYASDRGCQLIICKVKSDADVCGYDCDNKACEAYVPLPLSILQSCLEGRAFVDEVHATLPREIRDMIWTYLLDTEPKAVMRLDQALLETVRHARYCEERADGPWFVQACFVGPWVRVEILELRYRKLFTTFVSTSRDVSLLHDLASVDAYHTGLKPMQFVRHLTLRWDMGASRDPAYWPQTTGQPSWKACFEALLQIRYMSTFSLGFQVRESGPHFEHLLETFRPMYERMTAAGAKITIKHE